MTSPNPLLSVLLPNYNNGKFIEECLQSLLQQSFEDFIIILVDDCSTDDSIERIEKFNDSRIQLLKKKVNSGIVDTLNLGLAEVRSKYIVRMDGDDISQPDRFEKLVNFMEKNPDFGICGSSIQTFGTRVELQDYPKDPDLNLANLIFGHTVGHASCIFRTSILQKNKITYLNGFWRLEDYFLFYRLKDITKMTSLDAALYLYRQEDYNQNESIRTEMMLSYKKMYEMILCELFNSETVQEEDVNLHLELSGLKTPSFRLSKYKDYALKLNSENAKSRVYPKLQFKDVIDNKLNRLCYRLIDNHKFKLIDLLHVSNSNIAIIRYFISTKLKKTK